MSNVVLPTTWQYGTRTGWLVHAKAGDTEGWCPSPLRAHGLVGKQRICISIFPGRKWISKWSGNLFKVRQLVEAPGTGVFNLVSSQSHCRMLLPKVTGKCDKEGMGCHSPPSSHRYCRRCPDAGGRSRIRGVTGPGKPLLRTTLHLPDGLRGAA